MHAPEVTEFMKHEASRLDAVSDDVDLVNKMKFAAQTAPEFDAASEFDTNKDKEGFRRYEEACDRVKNFYAEQHEKQTLEWNIRIRTEISSKVRAKMSIWEAMELLETLVDDSDPDTSVGQIEHLLQTAEAIRRDGKPDWMQVVGLVHDLGKILVCMGVCDGQWDCVGDTFVVGCKFSDKIVYPDTFKANPDYNNPKLMTENGIYEPGCGLENVLLSFGHDEYIYKICKEQSTLPREALAMLRYHSFYPWHREGAYHQFMNEEDQIDLKAVRAFNPYDLYSKSDEPPKVAELKPYYLELIKKYFPDELEW